MEPEERNIAALPDPRIIEEVSFEALFNMRKAHLLTLNPVYELTMELESDPLVIDLQVNAYREYILRQRINLAAQARLLAKAQGADLDHLGDFYGLVRKTNETDAAYRFRIRERIQGSSTAGSKAHYRTRARETDPAAIRDVAVDSPEGGLVRISVHARHDYCFQQNNAIKDLPTFKCKDFCTDENDLTDRVGHRCPNLARMGKALGERVSTHVHDESIRMLTDTIQVGEAEKVKVKVVAEIYLSPETPTIVLDHIRAEFLNLWDEHAVMGWDVTPSWIVRQLHREGVYEVKLSQPAGVVGIKTHQIAEIGELVLIPMKGTDQ